MNSWPFFYPSELLLLPTHGKPFPSPSSWTDAPSPPSQLLPLPHLLNFFPSPASLTPALPPLPELLSLHQPHELSLHSPSELLPPAGDSWLPPAPSEEGHGQLDQRAAVGHQRGRAIQFQVWNCEQYNAPAPQGPSFVVVWRSNRRDTWPFSVTLEQNDLIQGV